MSNKQRLTIEVISKDDALSLIKNNAEGSGPGLIMTEAGKSHLTNQIHEDSFTASDIVNKEGNFDIIEPKAEPSLKIQNEEKPQTTFKSKLRKSGMDLKNKNKIKIAAPKLK